MEQGEESTMNGLTREQKSLINRRANRLAQSAYAAYQQRLTTWVIEQQRVGNSVSAEAINAAAPDLTDLMRTGEAK